MISAAQAGGSALVSRLIEARRFVCAEEEQASSALELQTEERSLWEAEPAEALLRLPGG